ncbi:MAG: adenylate/guanylate cyclase domain-containing protein [Hormoscilla sp.]
MSALFRKTLLGQIVLFGFIAVSASAFSAWHLHWHLTAEYRSKGRAIARSVAYSTETMIYSSPPETIQSVIDEFLEIEGVAYMLVVDADRAIIAHTFVPRVPPLLLKVEGDLKETDRVYIRELQLKQASQIIEISAPILAGAGGRVYVGMDKGPIVQNIHRAVARQLGLISLLFIMAAIASYLRIKKISEPLKKLTEYAEKLSEKDFAATVAINSRDEIGLLAETMQSMAGEISGHLGELERAVRGATREVRLEKEKSDRLLMKILPETIAEQLKEGENNIADGFAEVTILFADIVGFTQLSEQITPEELVELLNEIFSAFDLLAEQHGLEKIKTIGDAYMVVGGLPLVREDHAETVAEIALDMQQEVRRISAEKGRDFSIRIGINTGPVVAGVIGTKKFIYDLWGDAVNMASRMESHGIAGEIQVTESTYNILQAKYSFKKRGEIEVKGKGKMTTYLLLDRNICSLPGSVVV